MMEFTDDTIRSQPDVFVSFFGFKPTAMADMNHIDELRAKFVPQRKARCAADGCTEKQLSVDDASCNTCGIVMCENHLIEKRCPGRSGICSWRWQLCPDCVDKPPRMPCVQCRIMTAADGDVLSDDLGQLASTYILAHVDAIDRAEQRELRASRRRFRVPRRGPAVPRRRRNNE